MSDQQWPSGPYQVPQQQQNPYMPQQNYPPAPPAPPAGAPQPAAAMPQPQMGAVPPMPNGGMQQPVPWANMTAPTPRANPLTTLFEGRTSLWITIVRVCAVVFALFFFILGIFMCSWVSDITETISGGFFSSGEPNTGLAVLFMFGLWILGFVVGFMILLAADVASDIHHLRENSDQRN